MNQGAQCCVSDSKALPPDLDGYVVATPASTHHAAVLSLLDRQRPIYVEKPLTNSARTARHLADLAPNGLFVMEKWRYHGGVRAIAARCGSGDLGKVRTIRCRRVQSGQSQQDVNPVWTLLPHDLSIVDHILGKLPSPVSARASVGPTGEILGLCASLEADGVDVSITISSLSPHKERSLEVTLEGGTLLMADPLADHVLLKPAGDLPQAPWHCLPVDTDMPLLMELKAFVEHLRGGPPPMIDAARSARSVALIEALLRMASVHQADTP